MDKLLLPLSWTSAEGTPSALSFGTASKGRLAAHMHSESERLALEVAFQSLCIGVAEASLPDAAFTEVGELLSAQCLQLFLHPAIKPGLYVAVVLHAKPEQRCSWANLLWDTAAFRLNQSRRRFRTSQDLAVSSQRANWPPVQMRISGFCAVGLL